MKEGEEAADVAVAPLAIPMLAGPAALSTVAVLMAQAQNIAEVSLVYLAIAATGIITFVTLRLAEPIQRRLGKTGIHILGRVLGSGARGHRGAVHPERPHRRGADREAEGNSTRRSRASSPGPPASRRFAAGEGRKPAGSITSQFSRLPTSDSRPRYVILSPWPNTPTEVPSWLLPNAQSPPAPSPLEVPASTRRVHRALPARSPRPAAGMPPVHVELQRMLSQEQHALVELPRDHGKSTQVCGRILWELGRNPALRVKIICATDDDRPRPLPLPPRRHRQQPAPSARSSPHSLRLRPGARMPSPSRGRGT